jgi:alpha-tubulin suppressor-like RCC1 family protein
MFRENNPPAGLTNVVAVTCGIDFTTALTADGRLTCWGRDREVLSVPTELANVIAIHSCSMTLALTAEGRLLAWGDNTYGQCNVPEDLCLIPVTILM